MWEADPRHLQKIMKECCLLEEEGDDQPIRGEDLAK